MKTISKLLLAVLTVTASVQAFSPSSMLQTKRSSVLTVSHFANAVGLGLHGENDESSYRYILSKARECAFSDCSTSSEAKRFLKDILELESGCVSGNLAGHDICDNVDEMATIVAHLRQKVENNTVLTRNDRDAASTMAALVGISLFFAILGEVSHWQGDATPFTTQEWIWAMQGGYLDDMVMHYMRNGGL